MINVKTDVSGKWVAVGEVEEVIKKCIELCETNSNKCIEHLEELPEIVKKKTSTIAIFKGISFGTELCVFEIREHFGV